MKFFFGCSQLLSLPDISDWNTFNVKDMSYLFSGCNLLLRLPEISKWKINNVINMSGMFNGCSSLVKIPDISKWKADNIIEIDLMFYGCHSLLIYPDISKLIFNKKNNKDSFSYNSFILNEDKKYSNFISINLSENNSSLTVNNLADLS